MTMAFDLERFYRELDAHYAAHDNREVEKFFRKSQEAAYNSGMAFPANDGCPSCVPELKPNMEYVAVCNEMACFYRGLSRFTESLETFELAKKELESLYCQNTVEYATVLLNMAGTYRYMKETDCALKYFTDAAKILEQQKDSPSSVLAGLYNNIGLVYLDRQEPGQAIGYFEQALSLVSAAPEQIVELGTTWNNLAVGYDALGKQTEAKMAVQNAVAILSELDDGVNPHYPAALNTRGTFAYRAGEYDQALADFTQALEKTKLVYGENIEYTYGCDNCAAVCKMLGHSEEAEQWARLGSTVRERLMKTNSR